MSSRYVYFESSFSPLFLDNDDNDVLYLGASNKLYRPTASMTVGSFRAVFRLLGLTAGDLPSQVKAFSLNFGDDTLTGITTPLSPEHDGSAAESRGGESWYTLDGRRLDKKPTQRGLYIQRGRKAVVSNPE